MVVDYKTDAWRDDADLDAKVARYRLQGASYAVALEAATGQPVVACVFLFLATGRRGGADDQRTCRRRCAEVRALLGASAAAATNTSTPPIGPVTITSAM